MSRVFLVEPWLGGSHRSWAEGFVDSSANDVVLISHPGRSWRWRLQGAAVTLAAAIEDEIAAGGAPDILLVSDMVDLAQLLGLLRHRLGDTPTVLYMHENQLAFPRDDASGGGAAGRDSAAHNWLSLVVADLVMVNSEHHRQVIEEGVRRFVADAPDMGHEAWVEPVLAKLVVVPVGVRVAHLIDAPRLSAATEPPLILWNHRWDVDKQPEVFLRALERMAADGVEYRVALAGEDPWNGQRRTEALGRLGDRVVHEGTADPETYRKLLLSADICVSVSKHEFFGISIVEAVAAGCVPVLPQRLSYPELIPSAFHGAALYPDGAFRRRLAEVAADLGTFQKDVEGLRSAMGRFDWQTVTPRMDELLDARIARPPA